MRFFPLLSFIRKKKLLAKEITTAIKQRIKSILNNTQIIIGKNMRGMYAGKRTMLSEDRHKQTLCIAAGIYDGCSVMKTLRQQQTVFVFALGIYRPR